VFEDSSTCLNFDDPVRPHPCIECPMMEFVPLRFQAKIAPCRFASLAENVETVDHFSRCGTQMEVEGPLPVGCASESDGKMSERR
jgi:hypothetical protein